MNVIFNPYGELPEVPGTERLTPEERQEVHVKALLVGCMGYPIIIGVMIVLCILVSGCTTTRYVEVVEHRTDTLRVVQAVRDSVMVHDSVIVMERGDTVFVERWRERVHASKTHDTVYRAMRDTVVMKVPVQVAVEKEKAMTKWQKARMTAGDVLLVAVASGVVVWLVRRRFLRYTINNNQ